MLRQLAAVFPAMAFCPTGGIQESDLMDYLRAPNVFAVGGSWLTPRPMIATEDWSGITHLAQRAADVCRDRLANNERPGEDR